MNQRDTRELTVPSENSYVSVAPMGERKPEELGDVGSNPTGGTDKLKRNRK